MVRKRISAGMIMAVVLVIATGIVAALFGVGILKLPSRSNDSGESSPLGYNRNAKYIVDVYEAACLRKEPYVNSEVLSYIDRNQEVRILSGWGDSFVQVEAENGEIGYIYKDYIVPEGPMVRRANQTRLNTENDSRYYVTSPSSLPVYNGYKEKKVETHVPISFITNATPVRIINTINDSVAEIVVLDSGIIGYVNTEKISNDKKNADKFRKRIVISETDGKLEVGAVVALNAPDRVPVFREADRESDVKTTLAPGSWLLVKSNKDGFCYVADAFNENSYLGYIESRYLYVK